MALIKCPECKKKISDQCENCPNCGYPIDKICETEGNQTIDSDNTREAVAKNKKSFDIKSLFKKWWFWVAVGVVIVAITVTTILLLNRDTKPKFDKEGNPVFVELTNEVYTNAKKYKGYHINIKGKVFQVMGDNGNVKGIQIWLDPDTCEQNMMIYYNTDVEVKQGDYIVCSAYIDSVEKYKNAYDAEQQAPLVFSNDLRKSTYMEVMAPTTATITPKNLKQEKYGYSVSVNKVEFAEKETRVYVTVTNKGKALLNFGDAVIVQNGKQYNSTDNYEAEYEKIPFEIVKGVSCSGVIVFPSNNKNDFELTIDVHSDDYDEEIDKFTFKITKDAIVVEKQESKTPSTNQISSISNQKNKNKQAVTSAEEIADVYATVYPNMVKELLIDDYGFTETQAIYGIKNANIDWYYYAVIHLEEYVGISEGNVTKSDAERHLSADKGYSDAAIKYAFSNANIDWNKALNNSSTIASTTPTTNRDAEAIETARWLAYYDYTATPADIQQRLVSEEGFSTEDAKYCVSKVDNVAIEGSKYNWAERVEYYVIYEMQDYYIKYTWCNKCGNVYGVYEMDEKCPICGRGIQCSPQSAFGYTKSEVISKLKAEGFSENDIQDGLRKIPEDKFYDESKYKKP